MGQIELPGPVPWQHASIEGRAPERIAARTPLALRLTRASLSLTVASLPLYVVRWHYGPLPTTLLETLVLLTAALYVAAMVVDRGPLPRRTPLDPWIALLVAAAVIGVFIAPDHRGALGIFRAYVVEPVAVYYIAVAVLDGPGPIRALLVAWAVGATLFAVVDLGYFAHAVLAHRLTPGHAAAAFYVDPNSVALFLEPLIALGAGFALFARGRTRVAAMALVALLLVAEVATLSRGGLLAMAGLGVLAVVSIPSTKLRVALVAAAAAGEVVVLNLPVLGARVAQALVPGHGTFSIRTQIWTVTLRMLRDHPIFGAGLNAYQATMRPYRAGNPYLVAEPYPHNILLTSWTELGLLGLVAFGVILVMLTVLPWRALPRATGIYRPLLWGVGAAFIVIVLHGLVDSPYWKNDLSVEFWVLAALAFAAFRAVMGGRVSSRPG